jgi:WD40 repeat protein
MIRMEKTPHVMRYAWMLLALAVVAPVRAVEPELQLKLLGTLPGARPTGYATIAFSPDGKVVAASDNNLDESVAAVKLWDVQQRRVIAVFRAKSRVYSVAFSPDGKTLAASDEGMTVTLWEVATGKKKASFKGEGGPVAFSPDGKTLATGGPDGIPKFWDLSTGKAKSSLKEKGVSAYFPSLTFSPDGTLIASPGGRFGSEGLPGEGEVKLWEVATGRERASLKGRVKLKVTLKTLSYLKSEGVPKHVLLKLATLNGVAFPTEEDVDRELPKMLDKILDKEVQRKKYSDLMRLQVGTFHEGPEVVWAVAFSPDSKTLASASVLGSILLWDVQSGKRTATLHAFNPNGREKDINGAYSVAFSPNGSILAAGTLRGIQLWDVKSGARIGDLSRPSATVWSVAFSPDGKTLASAGSKWVIGMKSSREGDPTLRLWELVPSTSAP